MKIVKSLVVISLVATISQVAAGEQPGKADQEKRQREQLRIAVQEICPVSGNKLGSMGAPVQVQVGEQKEQVFLCCAGCAKGKFDPKHWATVHTNIAKAQGKCPVMEKALPAGAKWAVVEGQVVYVCCPPCIQKIVDDPATHLRKVDAYYAASLRPKQAAR